MNIGFVGKAQFHLIFHIRVCGVDGLVSGRPGRGVDGELTLLDAVLLGTLVVGVLLLSGDTLNALVEVVLEGGALGGVGALCNIELGVRQSGCLSPQIPRTD